MTTVSFLRFVDRYLVGTIVVVVSLRKLLCRRTRPLSSPSPRTILVIRLWGLGSSLLGFPMIVELRRRFPSAQLDLLASSRNVAVYRHQGYFANAYNLFSVRDLWKLLHQFRRYDMVLDCEEYLRVSSLMAWWLGKVRIGYGNLRVRQLAYTHSIAYNDRQHAVLSTLDLLNPLGIQCTPPCALEPLNYTNDDKCAAEKILCRYAPARFVCMHVGAAETSRDRLWPARHWAELVRRLLQTRKEPTHIFLSGTKQDAGVISEVLNSLSEQEKAHVTDLCGAFTVHQFAAFLERVHLMISNDTGPMHLAAAMGTPTVGLFGPNLPERFAPYPPSRHRALYKGDGTAYVNVHHGTFASCPPHVMEQITPEEVCSAACELLNAPLVKRPPYANERDSKPVS